MSRKYTDIYSVKKAEKRDMIELVCGLVAVPLVLWGMLAGFDALADKTEAKGNKKSKTNTNVGVCDKVYQIDANSSDVADYMEMQKQMEKEVRDIQIEMERAVREMEKSIQEMQAQFKTR
jgi:hypothetical protein